MLDIQTIAAIIFVILLSLFLYLSRKKLDTKFMAPHFIYFSMYKTKLGLNLMDSMSKKFKKATLYLGYFGIIIGFLGMIFISYVLTSNIFAFFTKPEAAPGVSLVLPIQGKGIFYVPFFYWIISIFVIAVVHEFSHGLIARAHKIKVKSSGFAFLGLIIPIIPAAFVEPDEKELRKRPHSQQLSVFAAGPLANIITGLVCLLITLFVLAPVLSAMIEIKEGVRIVDYVKGNETYPAEKYGIKANEVILQIDNQPTYYLENLSAYLSSKKPGSEIAIKTNASTYKIVLASNPGNGSKAFIGAKLEQNSAIKESVRKNFGEFLPKVGVWIFGLFEAGILDNNRNYICGFILYKKSV